jgi:UDP:flavonoid glycosyltransferase YjiC (YdhE family)
LPKPAAVIEGVPPSLLDPSQYEGWFMRDIPYAGGAVLGDSLPQRHSRPRIAVTLGSTLPRFKGMGLLDPVIAAAGDVDADFLLAIGGSDPASLGALPPNVSTIGFTPFDQLLRTCHAVVHKGASTTMAAIDAGLPQLVFDLDPLVHGPSAAEALATRGTALVIAPEKIDADAFLRLLTDPGLRTAAEELRAENAALPSPAATAERLSTLAG